MCQYSGLLKNNNGRYNLTMLAKEHLLKDSPFFIGDFIETRLANNANVDNFFEFKKSALYDRAQIYKGDDVFKTHELNTEVARKFTNLMHCKSLAISKIWPKYVDLSQNSMLLDIGGGSGVHSISAVAHNNSLQVTIFDIESVCEIAKEYINASGFQNNIKTQPGSIFDNSYPSADCHFYSDILHDWTKETGYEIIKKSYDALPSGGKIIILEKLFNSSKTGPMSTIAYNALMIKWTEGSQYSDVEITNLLERNKFLDVEIIELNYSEWSLIIAKKSTTTV